MLREEQRDPQPALPPTEGENTNAVYAASAQLLRVLQTCFDQAERDLGRYAPGVGNNDRYATASCGQVVAEHHGGKWGGDCPKNPKSKAQQERQEQQQTAPKKGRRRR